MVKEYVDLEKKKAGGTGRAKEYQTPRAQIAKFMMKIIDQAVETGVRHHFGFLSDTEEYEIILKGELHIRRK